MLVKTRGLFLHSIKYTDSSVIAHIYTEEFGQRAYIISGIHSKKSKSRANLLQALFPLQLELYHKGNGNSLQRIKEVQAAFPLNELPFDVYRSSQAIFIAELLSKILREEEANAELFAFLFSSVEYLDITHHQTANYLLVFLLQLSKHLGVSPPNDKQEGTVYFDLLSASYTNVEPNHHNFLTPQQSLKFNQLSRCGISAQHTVPLTGAERKELLTTILNYYKIHLDINCDFKSLAVLSELMS